MLIGDSPNDARPILTHTENAKKLAEDIEHLYFIGVGILMTALSNPWIAVGAAMFGVAVRQIRRDWRRGGQYECSSDSGDGCLS